MSFLYNTLFTYQLIGDQSEAPSEVLQRDGNCIPAPCMNVMHMHDLPAIAKFLVFTVLYFVLLIWCYDVACGCLEAERAIITYTNNLAELLRRKKVWREVLFQYADREQISVKPNDEKLTLIQRILCHLGSRPLPVGYSVVWIHYNLPSISVVNWLLYLWGVGNANP